MALFDKVHKLRSVKVSSVSRQTNYQVGQASNNSHPSSRFTTAHIMTDKMPISEINTLTVNHILAFYPNKPHNWQKYSIKVLILGRTNTASVLGSHTTHPEGKGEW